MRKQNFFSGQGATEYLVVFGVVLIISLVSVSLLGGVISNSSDTKETASNMYWQGQSKPFRIPEAALTNDSKLVFTMENSEADPITLTRITMGGAGTGLNVDGTNAAFGEGTSYANNSTVYFGAGEKKQIGIDFGAGNFNCREGQITKTNLVITYRTQNGIEKTEASSNGFSIRCNMNSGSYSATGGSGNCKNAGIICSSNSDCCSGNCTQISTNVPVCTGCYGEGTHGSPCCSGLVTSRNGCVLAQSNLISGQSCNANVECASGNCVQINSLHDFVCDCAALGAQCPNPSWGAQCCSGLACSNNTCTIEKAPGEICTSNSECASGNCLYTYTGQPMRCDCSPEGAGCTVAPCCSGLGLHCDLSMFCATCAAQSHGCSQNSDCCTGNCIMVYSGNSVCGCVESGAQCPNPSWGGQCCSGSCNGNTCN